jgi:beta-lactamase regulating signal transducer with metallopeptidase domain
LLILAWLGHIVLSKPNPRWRVLLWRSVAVGVAMIAVLSAAPPVVIWRVPRADAMVVQEVSGPIIAPFALPSAPPAARPSLSLDRRTSGLGLPTGFEGGKQSVERSALIAQKQAETRLSFASWLLAIWLAGVGVMAARLGLSLWGLSKVIGRSAPVPAWIVEESRAVAKAVGCRRAIRVVESAEVPTPCLSGLSRPILLLPGTNCEENDRVELRAILTHELAHARNHDLAWNFVLELASILLWFHPLAWRIRAAHIAACDAVCDAVAADLLGDVALYGRTLARLALQVGKPAPKPGLAMARTPDVLLRIEALQRRVFRSSLSWRFVMPTLLIGAVLVTLIGGFGIARAKQSTTPKDTQAKPIVPNASPSEATKSAPIGPLALRVLSAKTGEPLEGVAVFYKLRAERKDLEDTVKTGKDGTTAIKWPAGITIHSLRLDVKKPGYVAMVFYWSDDRHAISLPESQEVRLEPGVPISGLVQDEAGKPIAGANVTAMSDASEMEEPRYSFELGTAKTDEQGRWRIDDAPANLSPVSVHISHPEYLRRPGSSSVAREQLTVLTQGATVKGRVVGGSGTPIKGAQVDAGPAWEERKPVATDELGEYTLRNRQAGPTIVTA